MIRRVVIIGLLALAFASSAMAATRHKARRSASSGSGSFAATTIGPRVGFSVDPDQIVVGGHLSTGFARNWTINPSVEIGFGDNQTVTALNFDAEYHFRVQGSTWSPYAGLGMGIHFVHADSPAPYPDVNDTASGLNIIVGTLIPAAPRQNIFTELRVGTGDAAIPDFKGIIGWNFRL